MKKEFTLRLDKAVVRKAKKHRPTRRDICISDTSANTELGTITKSMLGAKKQENSSVEKADSQKHLEEKYL